MSMDIRSSSNYHDKIQFNGQGHSGAYTDTRESIAAMGSDAGKTQEQIMQAQQATLDTLSSDHLLNMATRPFNANTTEEEKKISRMAAQTLLNRGYTTFNGVDEKAGLQSIAAGNAPTEADRKVNHDNKKQLKEECDAAFGDDPAKAKEAAAWLLDHHPDYFSAAAITQLTTIAGRDHSNTV